MEKFKTFLELLAWLGLTREYAVIIIIVLLLMVWSWGMFQTIHLETSGIKLHVTDKK